MPKFMKHTVQNLERSPRATFHTQWGRQFDQHCLEKLFHKIYFIFEIVWMLSTHVQCLDLLTQLLMALYMKNFLMQGIHAIFQENAPIT
jgi:hypothetical protein